MSNNNVTTCLRCANCTQLTVMTLAELMELMRDNDWLSEPDDFWCKPCAAVEDDAVQRYHQDVKSTEASCGPQGGNTK